MQLSQSTWHPHSAPRVSSQQYHLWSRTGHISRLLNQDARDAIAFWFSG